MRPQPLGGPGNLCSRAPPGAWLPCPVPTSLPHQSIPGVGHLDPVFPHTRLQDLRCWDLPVLGVPDLRPLHPSFLNPGSARRPAAPAVPGFLGRAPSLRDAPPTHARAPIPAARPGHLGADLPHTHPHPAPPRPRGPPGSPAQLCEPRVRGPRRRRLLDCSQNKQPKATSSPGGQLSQQRPALVAAGSGFLGQHNPTSLTGQRRAGVRTPGWSRAQLRICAWTEGAWARASPAEAQQSPAPLRDHSPDSSAHLLVEAGLMAPERPHLSYLSVGVVSR